MSHQVRYDAAIIKTFATKLYLRAQTTVRLGVVAGAFVGLGLGGAAGGAAGHAGLGALVGMVFGAFVGYVVGLSAAFKLKLQAQIALCQVQIEENTRAGSAAQRPGPRSVRPQAA